VLSIQSKNRPGKSSHPAGGFGWTRHGISVLALYNMASYNNGIPLALPHGRPALVIAHPGHELCVYHWLRLTRPCVFILTDGSGRSDESRLHSTTRILEQNRAGQGCIFGRHTDREIYLALMDHELDLFLNLVQELAAALVRERIDYVVGDAIEGYNPSHDLCCAIINAAVEIASRERGSAMLNFDVLLTSEPEDQTPAESADALWLHLNEDDLSQKVEVALGYSELAAEVRFKLKKYGMRAFKTECLRRARRSPGGYEFVETPYYELYGEGQVAAGHYKNVLRYRQHVLPVALALQNLAESLGCRATCAY
jgi:hypothetical protein